jgi:8-oxo-dGTP pyrophosphatase MutT (NUDIX family)
MSAPSSASASASSAPARRSGEQYVSGLRCRASCVVFSACLTRVLLVTGRKRAAADAPSWVLPGGGVHVGEALAAAAARETMEEAGAAGAVSRAPVASVDVGAARTAVFVMRFARFADAGDAAYEDAASRAREWVPTADVRGRLKPKALALFDAAMAGGAEAVCRALENTI